MDSAFWRHALLAPRLLHLNAAITAAAKTFSRFFLTFAFSPFGRFPPGQKKKCLKRATKR